VAEDLTARAVRACVPLLDRSDVPEHVWSLTSPQVLVIEADIVTRLASRAETPARPALMLPMEGLDEAQQAAVTVPRRQRQADGDGRGCGCGQDHHPRRN
jgi:hypothetical protein